MSNYIRTYYPGGTFFFTLVTYNRHKFLTRPLARNILRDAIQTVRLNYSFIIDAICLLPDHLHCILNLPEGDADYANWWRRIKAYFSRAYRSHIKIYEIPQSVSRIKRNELPIWQRRYWEHKIRDDDDYRRHVDYIHFNPVKHGYVKKAVDYPWSSFHHYVREGVYDYD